MGAVRFWILLSALLVGAGWILSAFHELNRLGYAAAFALAAITIILFRRRIQWPQLRYFPRGFHKWRRRFKRPAPLIFLVLSLMALAGGALYAPMNLDSTSYRIPRVLHWLAQGRWHWIHTQDYRINSVGCGFEWLSAPLILFTRTDRFLFLINWVSYLLLPGLIFSVFMWLGVRRQVAWWWAWLLPSGWCYIMQAGSTINDGFAAVYALAAVDFALRARKSKRTGDVWISMAAAALLSGTKQTAIPLALLWFIAVWPCLRLLFTRWFLSLGVAAACVLVSVFPTTFFNILHTGNWMGVTEKDSLWALHSPAWGIIGNTFCLAAQNLKPPVFPMFNAWNRAMQHFRLTPFGAHFREFERFGYLSMGVGESSAGLGSAICLVLLVSLWAARHYRKSSMSGPAVNSDGWLWLVRLAPWPLLLIFMAKVGAFQNGRQLAPYYIFFMPSLLIVPGQAVVVRRRWWRGLSLAVMLLAAALLVVSRERPLFPAQTVTAWLKDKYPDSKFVSNLSHSFSSVPDFEAQRFNLMSNMPPGEPVIGYDSEWGLNETALWFPLWQRKVERVLATDTVEQLRASGIHYVVVEDGIFRHTQDTLPQWLSRYDGIVVKEWAFIDDPYEPPAHFYLIRLQSPPL